MGFKKDDPQRDLNCSFLDFWYKKDKQILDNINYSLKNPIKGKGFGRKLVESIETIGKQLGCKAVHINVNINPTFWDHMGYKPKEDYWEKLI